MTIPGACADALAVVALGANLAGAAGDPAARLEAALARFSAHGLSLVKRSRLWESAAWPDPADPPFLNAVALVEPEPAAERVLAILLLIEEEFGRVRSERNAPRTLDLDLIAHGRAALETPALTLPHPRAAERRFVMGPLAELAPEWRHPSSGVSARDLAQQASVGLDAAPLGLQLAAPLPSAHSGGGGHPGVGHTLGGSQVSDTSAPDHVGLKPGQPPLRG